MTYEEEKVFLDYLMNDDISTKNQITNSKNKRIVFLEEIDGKRYYIKKYIPKKKHQYKIFFGLKEDQAIHYKNICSELKKLKIPYIEPYYIKTFNKSLFKRTASILVTKDGGKSLMEYIPEFKKHLGWFDYFFYIFFWLTKNKIYISDYNLGGMIVGEDKVLRLIDLDSYRKKMYLTINYKKYIIGNLKNIYLNMDPKKNREFIEYSKNKIEEIIKKLGWEK